MKLYWFARSFNKKTGNMPHAVVGGSLKETRRSCRGCPLLDGECYAWSKPSPIVNFALRAKLYPGLVERGEWLAVVA